MVVTWKKKNTHKLSNDIMFLRVYPGGTRCRFGFFLPFAFRGEGQGFCFRIPSPCITPRSSRPRRRVSHLGVKTLPVFVVFASFLLLLFIFQFPITTHTHVFAPQMIMLSMITTIITSYLTMIALFRVISCDDGYNTDSDNNIFTFG